MQPDTELQQIRQRTFSKVTFMDLRGDTYGFHPYLGINFSMNVEASENLISEKQLVH